MALSLSWNKSRFDPPSMVVGGNVVKVSIILLDACVYEYSSPTLAFQRFFTAPFFFFFKLKKQVWQYDDATRKWEVACVLSPSPRGGPGAEGGIGGSIAAGTPFVCGSHSLCLSMHGWIDFSLTHTPCAPSHTRRHR